MEQFYYLLITLAFFLPIFILSFDERFHFWENKTAIYRTLFSLFIPFFVWHVLFVELKIWGVGIFYIGGLNLFGVSIEDVLLLLILPFSTLFVFTLSQVHFTQKLILNSGKPLVLLFALTSAIALLFFYEKMYSLLVFGLLLASLVFFFFRGQNWLGHAFVTFFMLLLPYVLLFSVVTGTGIKNEIIWYDSSETSRLRLGTIPLENFGYLLLMVLWSCQLFQVFIRMKKAPNPDLLKETYKAH